jgi:hypothetical protein
MARLRRSLLCCAVLLLAATACVPAATSGKTQAAPATTPASPPSTPDAPGIPAVGINLHPLWWDWSALASELKTFRAAGVTWMRMDIGWDALEPTAGTYTAWYVDRIDQTLSMAAAQGIHVLAMVDRTPAWANGGASGIAAPTDPNDYGNAIGWLAGHFAGRVGAWEIWNEPNDPAYLAGADPVVYTNLVKAAYSKIKAADPTVPVAAGALEYVDVDWMSRAYAAGIAGNFDILSDHPYQGKADEPPSAVPDGTMYRLRQIPALYSLMAANGDGAKPIWFSEFGWSTHANTASTSVWDLGVSQATQAIDLVRTLEYVRTSFPYVTNVFWYNGRNRTDADVQTDNRGLLNADLSAKSALATLTGYLQGTSDPYVSVAPARATEGNTVGGILTFPVTLQRPATAASSVVATTTLGTASADDVVLLPPTTVRFAPGQRTATVTVQIRPDTLHESNETILLTLSNPVGLQLGAYATTGTIVDDDNGPPGISVADSSIGEAAGRSMPFTLQLSAPSTVPVTVHVKTADGTASQSSDYWVLDQTVTIPAGSTTAVVYVGIRDDHLVEGNETFTLNILSAANAIVTRAAAVGTIIDND